MGKIRLAALGLLLVLGVTVAAVASPKTTDIWLYGSVDIDADGHVSALAWDPLPKGHAWLAERMAPAVRSWEFVAATVDGQPVPTSTGLVVKLRAIQREDGSLAIAVASARTGPMTLVAKARAPKFPREALNGRVNAQVVVAVEVAADGRPVVRDVEYRSDARNPDRFREAFVASATEAIEGWTMRPELVAGRATPQPIRIPVRYCLSSERVCARLFDQDAATDAADQPRMAESSAVSLKTDVSAAAI